MTHCTSNTALGTGGANVAANGTLEISGASTAVSNSIVANGGLVRVLSGALASDVAVNSSGTAVVNGTVTNLALDAGTLMGTGAVTNSVVVDTEDVIAPGNSTGQITVGSLSLGSGGRYEFEISNAAGAAGTGYDTINDLGSLSIVSGFEAASRFSIAISSLTSSGAPGLAENWDPGQSFQFVLVHAEGGIAGFDPAKFTVDASGFQNDVAGGNFSVAQIGNDLVLNFAPVPEPGVYGLLATALGILGAARLVRARRQRS